MEPVLGPFSLVLEEDIDNSKAKIFLPILYEQYLDKDGVQEETDWNTYVIIVIKRFRTSLIQLRRGAVRFTIHSYRMERKTG